jgi:hypothetical protein
MAIQGKSRLNNDPKCFRALDHSTPQVDASLAGSNRFKLLIGNIGEIKAPDWSSTMHLEFDEPSSLLELSPIKSIGQKRNFT